MFDNQPESLTSRRKAKEPSESLGMFSPASDPSSWEARKIWALMAEVEDLKIRVDKLEKTQEKKLDKENSYGNNVNV